MKPPVFCFQANAKMKAAPRPPRSARKYVCRNSQIDVSMFEWFRTPGQLKVKYQLNMCIEIQYSMYVYMYIWAYVLFYMDVQDCMCTYICTYRHVYVLRPAGVKGGSFLELLGNGVFCFVPLCHCASQYSFQHILHNYTR